MVCIENLILTKDKIMTNPPAQKEDPNNGFKIDYDNEITLVEIISDSTISDMEKLNRVYRKLINKTDRILQLIINKKKS